MNKKQMLEMLENIKTKIKQDKLENYELDNRVDELERIKNDLKKINDRISYLSQFVADEANYRNNYFALNDEALRFDLNKNVINSNLAIEANKNTISELNEDIAKANETIGSANLEIATLEEELMINGQLLRSLDQNSNLNEEKIINDDLTSARDRIAFLKNNIERLQSSIKNNNESLKTENSKTADLIKKMETANKELDKFDSNIVNTQMINTAKRKADVKELESLKYTKDNLEKRDKMLSIDYSMEFEKIYNNLQNNVITVEDASKAVESIVNTIPEGYFIEDIETKDSELRENREKQIEVQNRIDRLSEKLKDDSKYTVSAFVAERNNAVIKSWENKLNKYNMEKENLNKHEAVLNSDLRVYETMLQECNSSILLKGEELRGFGNDITAEDELSIQESLKSLRKEKQELQNEINEVKSNIVNNSNDIMKNENKLEKTEKLFNNLKSSLDERNSVDRSEKRLDELKLAAAVSTLSALKNRENYINESVLEVVDKAIGVTNEVEKTDEIVENKEFNYELQAEDDELTVEELKNLRNEFSKAYNDEETEIEKVETKDSKIPFPTELSTDDSKNNLYVEQEEKTDVDKINERLKELGIPAHIDLDNEKVNNLEVTEKDDEKVEVTETPAIEETEEIEAPVAEKTELDEEPVVEEEKEEKKRFACKFKDAKKELVAKAKSKEFKEKIFKFAKKAAALVAILVVTVGGAKMCGKLMEDIKNPTKSEDYAVDDLIEDNRYHLAKPNRVVNEKDEEIEVENNKEETSDYKEPDYNNNYESENNNNNNTSNKEEKPNVGNNSSSNGNSSNGNNSSSNGNSSDDKKPSVDNSHDNSDDIMDPNFDIEDDKENETPEVDVDTPVEAPDANIEDIEPEVDAPEVDEPEVNTDEENLNTVPDSDVTVTPDDSDIKDDVNGDVTVTPDADIEDTEPEVEKPEVEGEAPEVNDDIIIEDAEPEVDAPEVDDDHIFDNADDFEKPEVEEETPELNDDIIIEDSEVNTDTEVTPNEDVFDNLDKEDVETAPEINTDEDSNTNNGDDIIIEDAEVNTDTEVTPNEEVFDNLDKEDVETAPEIGTEDSNTNDDIIVEDSEPEINNQPDTSVGDSQENVQPEINNDNETNTNNDIVIEDTTLEENTNSDNVYDNLEIEVNPGETFSVETNSGETVEHTNEGNNKDQITFESSEIERESDLSIDELKVLREEFANNNQSEVVTEENIRTK